MRLVLAVIASSIILICTGCIDADGQSAQSGSGQLGDPIIPDDCWSYTTGVTYGWHDFGTPIGILWTHAFDCGIKPSTGERCFYYLDEVTLYEDTLCFTPP